MESSHKGLAPETVSIIENSLLTVCREMSEVVVKTAHSIILSEMYDHSHAVCDSDGRLVAMHANIPGHVAPSSRLVKAARDYLNDDFSPGDIILFNDPYTNYGGTHALDWTMVKPVFHQGKPEFFLLNRAHQLDSGGAVPGSYNPFAIDIHGECIRIPPIKIYQNNELRKDLWDFIHMNVRMSDQVSGDNFAQIGALNMGEKRLLELMTKYGIEAMRECNDLLIISSEKRVRAEIEDIPDGVYTGEAFADNDGQGTEAVNVNVTVTVNRDTMVFDFAGSHTQVKGMINSPLTNTYAAVYTAFLSVIDPDIPKNDGIFAPIDIHAPEGSCVNSVYPACQASATSNLGCVIVDAVWHALRKALPEKTSADWDRYCCPNIYGIDPGTGESFIDVNYLGRGGSGAIWGHDGWPHVSVAVTLGGLVSENIELHDILFPYITKRWEMLPESSGAGKWKGGAGMVYEIYNNTDNTYGLTMLGDGQKFPPKGGAGGQPGAGNRNFITRENGGIDELDSKGIYTFSPGDTYNHHSAGGGGVGNPFERDIQLVAEDVINEKLSPEDAEKIYGVVIDRENFTIDHETTEKLRKL
jgi:N-methylhydantoinase B